MWENLIRSGLFIGFSAGSAYGAIFGPSWLLWALVALCAGLGGYCGIRALIDLDDEEQKP